MNSTFVVCPFGLTTPSKAAAETDLFNGFADVTTVGGNPGATGVSNVITDE